jgi:hypothetical protein
LKLYILDIESVEDKEKSKDKNKTKNSISPIPKNTPEQLENFTNTLEICTWLVERPHILQLANQMLDAKKSSPDVTSNIFDNSGHISVGCSSAGSASISEVISSASTSNAIDDVRISHVIYYSFYSFCYNLIIMKTI